MAGKWLELLKEIAPHVTRIGIPFNPETAPYREIYLAQFKNAAASLGVEAVPAAVRNLAEFETIFCSAGQQSERRHHPGA